MQDRYPTTPELALDHIIEEASEVIKACIKIKRFGIHSVNPYKPEDGTNLTKLRNEVNDVVEAHYRYEKFLNLYD